MATRGKPFAHATGHKPYQVQVEGMPVFWPRLAPSQKPDIFQNLVTEMYPEATPRLELFARRPLAGWTVFGNEVGA